MILCKDENYVERCIYTDKINWLLQMSLRSRSIKEEETEHHELNNDTTGSSERNSRVR